MLVLVPSKVRVNMEMPFLTYSVSDTAAHPGSQGNSSLMIIRAYPGLVQAEYPTCPLLSTQRPKCTQQWRINRLNYAQEQSSGL